MGVPTTGTFDEVLAQVVRLGQRLRRPTRAVASRFVMATGLRLLPEPAAAWFARTVYGARFLHAIVSNLPGAAEELTILGQRTEGVHPVLPLAPGTLLALGAMSWADDLAIGLATDPALLDAQRVAEALRHRLGDLCEETSPSATPLQRQEQSSP
jgi:hypothetical protein